MPALKPTNAAFSSPTKRTAALSGENGKTLLATAAAATPTSKPDQRNTSVTHVPGVRTNAMIPNATEITKPIAPKERSPF
jgi:hypothetical protein